MDVLEKECRRIGLNIMFRRKELQMTQETLASLSGVSRSMLIAEALQIDYRELLK